MWQVDAGAATAPRTTAASSCGLRPPVPADRPRPSPPSATTGGTARGPTGRTGGRVPASMSAAARRSVSASASIEASRHRPEPAPSSAAMSGSLTIDGVPSEAASNGVMPWVSKPIEVCTSASAAASRRSDSAYGIRPGEDDGCPGPQPVDEPPRRAQLAATAEHLDVGADPRLGERLEERQQALLGAHAPEPHQARRTGRALGARRERGLEQVVVDAVPDDVHMRPAGRDAAPRHDAVGFEPPREVRRRGGDGIRSRGESAQVRPPVVPASPAARATPSARRSQAFSTRSTSAGERRGRLDPDVHAVVHRVHDRQAVARGEAVPDERAPEVGLDVHDVDLRPASQRGIHPSIRAPARPGHRVLAVERHRDRGQVDVGRIRRRPRRRRGPCMAGATIVTV